VPRASGGVLVRSNRIVEHGLTPEFVHISTLLRERFGFDDYYNRRAWSMIGRH
jgi:hypothetical protein